jgi:hypothetical protein
MNTPKWYKNQVLSTISIVIKKSNILNNRFIETNIEIIFVNVIFFLSILLNHNVIIIFFAVFKIS